MAVNLGLPLPEWILLAAGVLLLLLPQKRCVARSAQCVGIAAVLLAGCCEWGLMPLQPQPPVRDVPGDAYTGEASLALAIRSTLLLWGLLACGLQRSFEQPSDVDPAAVTGWLLFLLASSLAVTMADDLVLLLTAMEMTALAALFLLLVSASAQHRTELLLKLCLTNIPATTLVTLGTAVLVVICGVTDLQLLQDAVTERAASVPTGPPAGEMQALSLAAGLIFFGLAARLVVPPFHGWLVDVERSEARWSLTVTLMTVRTAALVACVRLMISPLARIAATMEVIAIVLSIAALVTSLALAHEEERLDRLLGCSAIATGGWLLAALAVWLRSTANSYTEIAAMGNFLSGSETLWLTFAASGLAYVGSQCGLAALRRSGSRLVDRADLRGIGRRFPLVSAAIVVCLLSLAGVPPWLGFWEKLAVASQSAIGVTSATPTSAPIAHGGLVLLAFVLLAHCLVQLPGYLSVVTTMFLQRNLARQRQPGRSAAAIVTVAASLGLTVTGFLPTTIIECVKPSIKDANFSHAQAPTQRAADRDVTAVSRRQSQYGYVPSPPGT